MHMAQTSFKSKLKHLFSRISGGVCGEVSAADKPHHLIFAFYPDNNFHGLRALQFLMNSPILRIMKREGCAGCATVARCSFHLVENQHAELVILK